MAIYRDSTNNKRNQDNAPNNEADDSDIGINPPNKLYGNVPIELKYLKTTTQALW